jgi:Fic family protein
MARGQPSARRVPPDTKLDRRHATGQRQVRPPPPHEIRQALDNLERFFHDEYGHTAPVIKAGLAHAQFETIHPFLDGNGRVGRLLISLILVADGVLSQPFLYLSLYLRERRAEYYDTLQRVRTHGDWEGWLEFYFIGIEAVANQTADTTRELLALCERDRARVQLLGKAAGSALAVYDILRRRIVVSAPKAADEAGITWPTANAALQRLATLGIVAETSGRRRDRLYTYTHLLEILDRGTKSR